MKLEIYNSLGQPQVIEAKRIVVLDNFGNPVSLSIEIDANTIISSHLAEPEFLGILQRMGINKTVILADINARPIQEARFS